MLKEANDFLTQPKIVRVDETNIGAAGLIHSESWKESHRGFCSGEFVAKHTPRRRPNTCAGR